MPGDRHFSNAPDGFWQAFYNGLRQLCDFLLVPILPEFRLVSQTKTKFVSRTLAVAGRGKRGWGA